MPITLDLGIGLASIQNTGGTGGAYTYELLLEDNFRFLLENGNYLLQEDSP